MANSTRTVWTIASLAVAAMLTQVAMLAPSNAQEVSIARPSPLPVAASPALSGPTRSSPALPMPEADAGSGLPIPQLVLHGPWLDDLSPDIIPSTAVPRGVGEQFTLKCTACSSRQF